MNPNYCLCILSVCILGIAGIGVGFAYSSTVETQNSIQSEWCTVIPNDPTTISASDQSFTTSYITYTDNSARSGFMTIIFKIGASGGINLEGSVLSISSTQLGSGTIGSCVLKPSGSTFTGTISGLYVPSGTTFTITGQLSSGLIGSVSMDIVVYPEVEA